MITISTEQQELLDSTVRGVTFCLELNFASGTQRYTTLAQSFPSGGFTWTGLGDLVSIPALRESEDTNSEKLTIKLNVVNSALLALAVGSVQQYRGRIIRLYIQPLNSVFQAVGDPILRWRGHMSKTEIPRETRKDGPSTGSINLVCSRAGLSRFRNASGLRRTHEQHIKRYPGDLGLEYQQELIEKPSLWLSKRFQEHQQ